VKLFEFEAKDILRKYGIAVPRGKVVASPDDAESFAKELGRPVMLKSQVLVSGRGKAGGILSADNPSGARATAERLLGSNIKGIMVGSLLVEEKLDITEQLYVSITVDRQVKTYVLLVSTAGGVDIEEVAEQSPQQITRHRIDPLAGLTEQDVRNIISGLKIAADSTGRLAQIITALYGAVLELDAELVELNPLVKTASGGFIAADARIIIDDNALYRHAGFAGRSQNREEDTPLEAEARKLGLAYVDLDGDTGIIGNGAGLVMATLDLVQLFGGKPANFLDIGGGAQTEIIKNGVRLVMSKPQVRAVLINILGGITRCDLVANGVVQGLNEAAVKKPVAVRMMGTNEQEGEKILREAGISSYASMEDAARTLLAGK
jgi:succinyl-CoA synthetase beta subunit